MSVPPLVCSTPPPPDQIDDEDYNDEFSINYEDSASVSPSHQYGLRGFSIPDSPIVKDPSDVGSVNTCSIVSNKAIVVDSQDEASETSEQSSKVNDISPQIDSIITNQPEILNKNKPSDSQRNTEENNIEDLDLKLDSLQIDFENGKESVEDSLNSTFDDFGTFLSSAGLTESIDDTFYLPKSNDSHTSDLRSDNDPKTHEASSDDSVSIPIDDNSDFDVGWENPNDHTDTEMVDDFQHCVNDSSADIQEITKDTSALVNDVSIDTLNVILESFSSSLDSPDSKSEGESADFKQESLMKSENLTSEGDILRKALNTGGDCGSDGNGFPVIEVNNEIFSDFNSEIDKTENIFVDNLSDDTNVNVLLSNGMASNDSCAPFTATEEEATKISVENKEAESCIPSITTDEVNCDISDSAIDDDFDDFATFQTADPVEPAQKLPNKHVKTIEKDISSGKIQFDAFSEEKESIEENVPFEDCDDTVLSDSDDFGDFGTYNPLESNQNQILNTAPHSTTKPLHSFQLSEFINSTESEIFEKICSAINSIFPEDNIGDESKEDDRDKELRSALGENWKHLKEYETEQSYLFQWNNSASQKSLLRSLGIDSRNILFGPKWNSGMPRFAANLGVSPLQPIKQPSNALNPTSEYQGEEKPAANSEVSGNIVHPNLNEWENSANFSAADLQASSYAESLLLDLEHLMATLDQMTSGQSAHFKISDLFINACNERGEDHLSISHPREHTSSPDSSKKGDAKSHPTSLNIGRKINLPDTHIFTPTDSKTPWSHTIHYGDTKSEQNEEANTKDFATSIAPSSPSVEFAKVNRDDDIDDFDDFQTHINNISKPLETVIITNPESTEFEVNFSNVDVTNQDSVSLNFPSTFQPVTKPPESVEDDFDDFGDFHSANVPKIPVLQPPLPLQSSSVLEPVKLSPAIPVVNWPEPGEVKILGFDDMPTIEALPPINPTWSTDIASTSSFDVPFSNIAAVSPAPKSFILKESKIVSDDFSTNTKDDIQDLSAFSDFTDFKSAVVDNSQYFPNTKAPSVSFGVSSLPPTFNNPFTTNTSVDDFDDFQSVEYNPTFVTNDEKVDNIQPTYSSAALPFQDYSPKPQISYQLPSLPMFKDLNFPVNQFAKSPLEPVTLQRFDESSSKNTSQQILQPLSLENYSQINWPDPGIDLQDLSRFNPINSIQTYSEPKEGSGKSSIATKSQVDDDGWSDFVSIKPSNQSSNKNIGTNSISYSQNPSNFPSNTPVDDGEDWSEFVSNTVLPSRSYSNEVKTISQNIHSQGSSTGAGYMNNNVFNSTYINAPVANTAPNAGNTSISTLPHLSYASSKANNTRNYNNHFQNL